MSRVEQAMRRAGNAAALEPEGNQEPSPAFAPGERDVLDLYPVERGTPAEVIVAQRPAKPTPSVAVQNTPVGSRIGEPHRVAPVRFGASYDGKIVTNRDVARASVEQYRRLAAALHHIQGEQGLRAVLVTSSVPQEGKTLTIVNLAMTLSESYKRRVLLVDADLRRPSIHDVFGIANSQGLCETLRSRSGPIPFVRISQGLSVLPAGVPEGDPMVALGSERMSSLLNELTASFDWVLIDAPPVALVPDAGLLVRLTRAVVLVIGANATPYKVIERVVGELGREHIIGAVLNRTDDDAAGWSGYYGTEDSRQTLSLVPPTPDAPNP